ncbi:hypothetical protein AGMMS49975_18390 [Clostridia bacterium]|nr:hypothetical protein AGMMS49975_18390 [Clostridia bacterium]GHU75057.1 hypothetical protein FACS1894188_05050 [Clostridia bacterium]
MSHKELNPAKKQLLIIVSALIFVLVTVEIVQAVVLMKDISGAFEGTIRQYGDKSLKDATQTAVSVVQMYYERYLDGKITYDEMKEDAKEAVISIRYDDGDGYCWIDDGNYICIAHPNTKFIGLDRYNTHDDNRVYFIREIIKAGDSGGGFTEFEFPRLKTNGDYGKRAYTLKFAPLNWYISTGEYTDDIDAQVDVANKIARDGLVKIISVIAIVGLVMILDKIKDIFS